nr:MAG TPA: hypothetical protein [Caudoviricetes sp.]
MIVPVQGEIFGDFFRRSYLPSYRCTIESKGGMTLWTVSM